MGEALPGEDTKQHGRKVALKVLPQNDGLRGDERLKALIKRFEPIP